MNQPMMLADSILAVRGRREALLRDMGLVVLGSILIAICARVQLPQWPVPITLQPFAVLLVGAALGSRRGSLAAIVYLLEGAAGLPVFASPPFAGIAYFAGPTAGYLLAFPVAALVVGHLAQRGWDRRMTTAAVAMAAGQAVILLGGFCWAVFPLGVDAALATHVVPFLIGDVLKILLAAAALPAGWRIVHHLENR
jgi:biotin transport system substrate-specific component